MSSPYSILHNRPIDQWKVVELKEELKKRKLATKGLKDELVKRLDEALRVETDQSGEENEEKEIAKVDNSDIELAEKRTAENEITGSENTERKISDKADGGFNSDPQASSTKDAETATLVDGKAEDLVEHGSHQNNKSVNVIVQVDIKNHLADIDTQKSEGVTTGDSDTTRVEVAIQANTLVTNDVLRLNSMEPEVGSTRKELHPSGALENDNSGIQLEKEGSTTPIVHESSKPLMDIEAPKPKLENEDTKPQLEDESSKRELDNMGLESLSKDYLCSASTENNQVSEVSPVLGFQVRSDSNSTDSVSINEKVEQKDNIIADNVKIEQDFVKPEMAEPSSSNVRPVGESHPIDVEEPLEKKASVEETVSNNTTHASVGYMEKLNLDRSSGDDSMEEDVQENKQIESKYRSDEVGIKTEGGYLSVMKEETLVDVLGDAVSADEKDIFEESKSIPVACPEKRKVVSTDQDAVTNNEPVKRQRKWNSENIKVPEPRGSTLTPITTPKDNFPSITLKHNFPKSDSSANEDTPKERIVPQSRKAPTNSLRIDRFLRPFTLKAVQELLGKTGTVNCFWMDPIKTHCYVTYASVEEAKETRNAVYNLQWPQNGGRLLVADFVDPQEVKMRVETLQTPTTPASSGSTFPRTQPSLAPLPSPRQQVPRQQLPSPWQQVPRQQLPPPPSPLPPPPPLPQLREHVVLPPPPPLPEKQDPPIVTLDDLFRKTKSTPRIYYLPLSDEEVAAKLAAGSRNTKQ